MSLLVNLSGLALIAAIVWWFQLLKRSPAADKAAEAAALIVVRDGIYEPGCIRVAAGRETELRFLREDPSPCAEYVVFADLDISAQLAVGRETAVSLPPLTAGEYEFTCQMRMYRGTLVVT
ncbi:cupredoxin domain-containing protein [Microbulbifer thermotolerans]|uniref:Cupredoxin domain-containing protein n=1 Tax=Microbulbifer thermotolerans TaxID=252514 RepID=A0A143HNQ0_MICTH|nr:cupredoxin domain-containing protein [Microbulbifer thermotolerans]AMX03339.1 plastocyanin [Microbulbifer thermotolerans]MCX2781300.1 cupredoxin domain-containing protein [Microbulbifer thermotolerans]MCX2794436.1 cupredoxin domain-containing protein [Microbulbifer thermotolerans]MCX2801075.1 cupredoxin domain-containing protein [Microbulbifer thermotolerans]MCX2804761.1 cupredoxin domain-containing protein [Microbulbifer thermotolerans]